MKLETTEWVLAQTLTDNALASRLQMIADDNGAFSKAQAVAFLIEAAARLNAGAR